MQTPEPPRPSLRETVHNEHYAELDEDDWTELAQEERMAKKVKRGHISQKMFDAEFGDL